MGNGIGINSWICHNSSLHKATVLQLFSLSYMKLALSIDVFLKLSDCPVSLGIYGSVSSACTHMHTFQPQHCRWCLQKKMHSTKARLWNFRVPFKPETSEKFLWDSVLLKALPVLFLCRAFPPVSLCGGTWPLSWYCWLFLSSWIVSWCSHWLVSRLHERCSILQWVCTGFPFF